MIRLPLVLMFSALLFSAGVYGVLQGATEFGTVLSLRPTWFASIKECKTPSTEPRRTEPCRTQQYLVEPRRTFIQ